MLPQILFILKELIPRYACCGCAESTERGAPRRKVPGIADGRFGEAKSTHAVGHFFWVVRTHEFNSSKTAGRSTCQGKAQSLVRRF